MSDLDKVLAVIPARAGSKGLPGKNFLNLCGKPLIQWTIEAALEAPGIDHVVVSSDDDLVLKLANSFGVTAYKRSAELCGDFSQASAVIADVIDAYPGFQTLVYLQPTSPLRRELHIREALEIFNAGSKNSVISVVEVSQPPEWMLTLDEQGLLESYLPSIEIRRQDTQLKYIPNGAIYIANINSLMNNDYMFSNTKSVPYVMDTKSSVDIDDKYDFEIAEWIIKSSCNQTAGD